MLKPYGCHPHLPDETGDVPLSSQHSSLRGKPDNRLPEVVRAASSEFGAGNREETLLPWAGRPPSLFPYPPLPAGRAAEGPSPGKVDRRPPIEGRGVSGAASPPPPAPVRVAELFI